MGVSYASEKFAEAVRILATKPGKTRDKLRAAFVEIIPISESEDIPSDLVPAFRELMAHLKRNKRRAEVGSDSTIQPEPWLDAMLFRMHERTATKIAELIYSLSCRLSEIAAK